MIAAQAELKKSSDTGSWGTSCLSPPFGDDFTYTGAGTCATQSPGHVFKVGDYFYFPESGWCGVNG